MKDRLRAKAPTGGWRFAAMMTLPFVATFISSAPAQAGETITYTYDNRGRLTAVNRTGSIDDMSTSYSYDNADNRTNFTASGVSGGGTTPYPNVVTQDPDAPDGSWNDPGSNSTDGGASVSDPGSSSSASSGGETAIAPGGDGSPPNSR